MKFSQLKYCNSDVYVFWLLVQRGRTFFVSTLVFEKKVINVVLPVGIEVLFNKKLHVQTTNILI